MINQQYAQAAYNKYLEKAQQDNRILGIILAGGRGKGMATENSDYDVILVTRDEDLLSVKNDYPKTEYIDSLPHAISDFRERAKMGTRTEYDKYTFTHVTAILDRNGEIQNLINEKGILDPIEATKIAKDALGGYLNMLYRSLKNFRDGNNLAGLLDASETVPRIIKFIFAIENRVAPFNKFLLWELTNYPLSKFPLETKDFLFKIESILTKGDIETQKELLKIIRQLALDNNQEEEIADWDGHYFG